MASSSCKLGPQATVLSTINKQNVIAKRKQIRMFKKDFSGSFGWNLRWWDESVECFQVLVHLVFEFFCFWDVIIGLKL